jgi:molybdenum cofactor biosynthesis protein B
VAIVTETKTLRCLVATIAPGRESVRDDVTAVVLEELRAAEINLVRNVVVNREKQFIEQLVRNVSTGNEADAVLLVGGAGIGPRDYACEAVEDLSDRCIEGFGEEYRRIVREDDDSYVASVLTRATAGVCDGCVVVALPRQPPAVMTRAMQRLVLPMLPRAVRIASGAGHVA